MDTVVIYNNQPRIFQFGKPHFKIVPGENDVPKDILQANLDAKNGVVKLWFKLGYLKIRKDVEKARPLAADLSQVSAVKARDLVKATENVAILQSWAKNEKRSTVLAAITKRLDELEKDEGDDDASEE